MLEKIFPHVVIKREGGKPYLVRYCLLGGSPYDTNHPWLPFNLFLHRFCDSDEAVPHNHPWKRAWSLILRGAYREYRLLDKEHGVLLAHTCTPGDIVRLKDDTFHWVELETPEVWTLFLCTRKKQGWGFQVGRRYVPAREYLATKPGATTNDPVVDG